MLNQNFVYVGVLFSLIGEYFYVKDTILGKIKPNKVSFALWSLAPTIAFFAEFKQGVGIQSLMALSVGLLPIGVFIASFVNKDAYWKITKFDLSCGLLSIIGLFLWYITKVGNIAILFSILADGLAYLPTIRKAYTFPETENALFWILISFNGLFTLLTIRTWSFANAAFPFYFLVANLLTFALIIIRTKKHKHV